MKHGPSFRRWSRGIPWYPHQWTSATWSVHKGLVADPSATSKLRCHDTLRPFAWCKMRCRCFRRPKWFEWQSLGGVAAGPEPCCGLFQAAKMDRPRETAQSLETVYGYHPGGRKVVVTKCSMFRGKDILPSIILGEDDMNMCAFIISRSMEIRGVSVIYHTQCKSSVSGIVSRCGCPWYSLLAMAISKRATSFLASPTWQNSYCPRADIHEQHRKMWTKWAMASRSKMKRNNRAVCQWSILPLILSVDSVDGVVSGCRREIWGFTKNDFWNSQIRTAWNKIIKKLNQHDYTWLLNTNNHHESLWITINPYYCHMLPACGSPWWSPGRCLVHRGWIPGFWRARWRNAPTHEQRAERCALWVGVAWPAMKSLERCLYTDVLRLPIDQLVLYLIFRI